MTSTPSPLDVYANRQRFAYWVYLVVLGVALVSGGAVWQEYARGKLLSPSLLVVPALLLLMVPNLLALRTSVNSECVHLRLGLLVPLFWKRIAVNTIRSARVVTYRPLRDAGGWGMRFGRFEGVFTVFWNARGNRGVLIETDARRYIIGSQEPERLLAAIERARSF
jgi:hypothetical protein